MNRIKNLREKEGISQDQLAKKLGVNLRTLQRWESGETSIRTKNATKIANFFKVPVSYLMISEKEWEAFQTLNSSLPTLEEFDKLLFKKQENRFKRFV